jgi:hypothetical protein
MINNSKLASWLAQAWEEYLRSGEHVSLNTHSSGWISNKIHASQLAMCAKKHAAQRLGLLEKETFDLLSLRRIETGYRTGESVAEAIKWYSDVHNQISDKAGSNKIIQFNNEVRLEGERIAGTPDILLTYIDGDKSTLFPIEVKHTENPFPGWSFHQVIQLIAYMNLLDANTGFLFTAYPMSAANTTISHRTWILETDANNDGWYLLDQNGNNVKSDYANLPRTWDGTIYITRTYYNELIENHELWESILKTQGLIEERPSDILDYHDWRCSRSVKAEYYQRKTGSYNAGDLKPGTGVIMPRCPLFKLCYPEVELGE